MMRRSYVCSPVVEPYMFETVPERLRLLADKDPEREAFVFYDLDFKRVSVKRKELYDNSIKLGKTFVSMGINKGDRVAFCMSNSLEMLYANFAVIIAGGVPFYLSTNLKDGSDVIKVMTLMECKMLIVDISKSNKNNDILEAIWSSSANSSVKVPSLSCIICNGAVETKGRARFSLSDILNRPRTEDVTLPSLDPEDILTYFCTSGSSGAAKNVAYTHFSLLNWRLKTNIQVSIDETSRFFNDRPFSWAVGYPRTYLVSGATRIFIDTKLSLAGIHIERLVDVIENERCDVMYVPGYIAKDLVNNMELKTKFLKVHSAILSGERVPKSSIMLKGNFFTNLYVWYGSAEAGGVSCFTNDDYDAYEDGVIGSPLEGAEMKVVDETGVTVEFGQTGELCVRCPWMFVGYEGMESLYHEVVDEMKWFHTGDLAHFRQDGNLVVDGRITEFVAIQTVKYFPWEVENALKDCPGSQYVVAVGVPDERLSNVFCACVVPQSNVALTVDDVKRYSDDVFLEEGTGGGVTIKPKYYLIFDKILITSSGKIDRRGMAGAAKERLGL